MMQLRVRKFILRHNLWSERALGAMVHVFIVTFMKSSCVNILYFFWRGLHHILFLKINSTRLRFSTNTTLFEFTVRKNWSNLWIAITMKTDHSICSLQSKINMRGNLHFRWPEDYEIPLTAKTAGPTSFHFSQPLVAHSSMTTYHVAEAIWKACTNTRRTGLWYSMMIMCGAVVSSFLLCNVILCNFGFWLLLFVFIRHWKFQMGWHSNRSMGLYSEFNASQEKDAHEKKILSKCLHF